MQLSQSFKVWVSQAFMPTVLAIYPDVDKENKNQKVAAHAVTGPWRGQKNY